MITQPHHSDFQVVISKLRTSRQYHEVYENGRKVQNAYFNLFVLEREGCEFRYGITVTKRVGTAVKRNRAKRIIRECFRSLASRFVSGYDVVIIARSAILTLKTHQLSPIVESLLSSCNALIPGHSGKSARVE